VGEHGRALWELQCPAGLSHMALSPCKGGCEVGLADTWEEKETEWGKGHSSL
jgi:hypothetical protein